MQQHESRNRLRNKRNSKPTQFYTRIPKYATVFCRRAFRSRLTCAQNPARTRVNRDAGAHWHYCGCPSSFELRSSNHALTCARSSVVAILVIKRLVDDFATR